MTFRRFIAIVALAGLGYALAVAFQRWWRQSEWPDYYQDLAKSCEKAANPDCCLSSVQTMAQGSFLLVPASGCPRGTIPNQLRCLDSLSWCEARPPSKRS